MTRLNIDYSSFDEYMNRALNSATRTKLRRKFRAARGPLIEMSVVGDVTTIVDDIYPLYLNVYDRSKLHFEKLTKEYFLPPREADAGQGPVLRLASEWKNRRVCRVYASGRSIVCRVYRRRLYRRSIKTAPPGIRIAEAILACSDDVIEQAVN